MVVDRVSNIFSLYIDGLLVDYDNISPNFGNVDVGIPISIGVMSLNNSSLLDGKADNLQIWNKALTQSEIQNYMSCPPTGNESGLVGYWNFNEGSGNTVTDLTSNGNNGTINGATWSTDAPTQYANNCTATDDVVVTVNPQDDATFAYSASSYCADPLDPNPINPTPVEIPSGNKAKPPKNVVKLAIVSAPAPVTACTAV